MAHELSMKCHCRVFRYHMIPGSKEIVNWNVLIFK